MLWIFQLVKCFTHLFIYHSSSWIQLKCWRFKAADDFVAFFIQNTICQSGKLIAVKRLWKNLNYLFTFTWWKNVHAFSFLGNLRYFPYLLLIFSVSSSTFLFVQIIEVTRGGWIHHHRVVLIYSFYSIIKITTRKFWGV